MRIGKFFLNLLYPPKCMFCHCLLKDQEDKICADCMNEIQILDYDRSKQTFDHIKQSISSFYYEGYVKEALHRYKFGGNRFYADKFAGYMFSALCLSDISADVITWVPLSRKRLRSRGYDQAQLLAEAVSKRSGIPCVRLLKKRKNVRPQSKMGDFRARKRNIAGAYIPLNPKAIAGRKILLIDDIVTTGATMSECADVLLQSSALEVDALTVARSKLD